MKQSFIIPFLLFISACTTTKSNLSVQEPDPALVRIQESVRAIERHSMELAKIQQAKYHKLNGGVISESGVPSNYIPGLNESVSLGPTYEGPLEGILKELSLLAGLSEPRFIGLPPTSGIIVSLSTDYKTVDHMLKDISAKTSSRVQITLKVRDRYLEVQYLSQ